VGTALKPTVAFIPARGGSKGIPGKNLALAGGRPLLDWVVDAALGARLVDQVVVSTDDPGIAAHATALDPRVVVHHRSAATASDTASTESAMLEFLAGAPGVGTVVLLQVTSPLTTSADVDGAVRLHRSGFSSVVSVVGQKRFRWACGPGGGEPIGFDPAARPRRQDHDGFLVENGAVYVTGADDLLASGCRVNGTVGLYEMDEPTYVEVDEPADLVLVDALLRQRLEPSTTTTRPAPSLASLAGPIRLLITDVDGCLTDNGMYYGASGEETKRFSARDGKGFELLHRAGVQTMLLTSEKGEILHRRAEKLGVGLVGEGSTDKIADADVVRTELGLRWEEVAFLGDDVHDVGLLERVGLAACPADAMDEVRRVADLCCRTRGGAGAFREVADVLLRHRATA
jgi:N-acylneuraminate cytidylyltransferase